MTIMEPEALAVSVPISPVRGGRYHVPTLARARGETWGVFCLACSEREQDYVFPCRDGMWPTDQIPPHFVVAAEDYVQLMRRDPHGIPDLAYRYDQE